MFIDDKELGNNPERIMLYHGETLFRNGECVGDIRAGSYGHTLKGLVGLGHLTLASDASVRVNKEYLATGDWQVEIAGTKYKAELSLQPFYDPKNLKIKG